MNSLVTISKYLLIFRKYEARQCINFLNLTNMYCKVMNLQIKWISKRISKTYFGNQSIHESCEYILLHSGSKFNISLNPVALYRYTRVDISDNTFAVIYKWFADAKVFWKVTIFQIPPRNFFNENICLNTFGSNLLFTANIYSELFNLVECNWNTLIGVIGKYFELTHGIHWKYVHMTPRVPVKTRSKLIYSP